MSSDKATRATTFGDGMMAKKPKSTKTPKPAQSTRPPFANGSQAKSKKTDNLIKPDSAKKPKQAQKSDLEPSEDLLAKRGKRKAAEEKLDKQLSIVKPDKQSDAAENPADKRKSKRKNQQKHKNNARDKDGKKNKREKHRKLSLAEKADKFLCYQKSVQCPEHDASFFRQAYREINKKEPLSLREDFCGTFAVCCEWVAEDSKRTAVGVDLCAETLQWGREHNLSRLKPKQQDRIRLLEQDVRVKNLPPVDVLAAQNFSFWIFQTRSEVITYLRAARENLKPGGIIVLDMMGGADCYREGSEDKKVIGKGKKKFSYYWKQVSFNPANNHARFAISFRFRDGSKLQNAFEYEWRFWTIPEVREMLVEAGFVSTRVYFENEDDDSIWESREHAPSHPVWLAYIVAVR
jgi:hypothetical protein